jgi:hypothetical protein
VRSPGQVELAHLDPGIALGLASVGGRGWEEGPIVRLTARLVSQSRVIARGLRIREVERLVATYGGRASRWVKKSSPPLDESDGRHELHWYEHPGIGRVEVRRKALEER